MKNFLFILGFTSCMSIYAQSISSEQIKKHIYFLASDELKGRATASPEEKKAAQYIANEFKKYQLKPIQKDYFYTFTFRKKKNPHDTSTSGMPELKGINVIALLDNKAEETIVIGAHYDHLGLGHDHNSLDPQPEGKIHNGADDNASGTSGLLELARYFSQDKSFKKYNILFIAFSGEELGLIGSKKWTENPTYPLNKIRYMINMDMVGRFNDSTQKLVIYGVGTSNQWVPLIDSVNLQYHFNIKKDSSGIGPSDQTSFYLKNIPVLHFFTGQHSDYHKPTDDADKINYKGEAKILEFIVSLIKLSAQQATPMQFQKTAAPKENKTAFKVTLGIMPDYTYEGKGVKIDGTTPGKPAEKAGLKAGDIILQMEDIVVNNMQDYMQSLSKFEKGQTIKVKVKRNNEELIVHVTF
ncbi:MAG: M28 family peptidase [Bacteroidia bacterium]|nr:M28 family peptidase [Bacteroidia bacterium]